MSTNRIIRGENRFYNPPPTRKLQQEREKKRLEQEAQENKTKAEAKEMLDRQKKEPLPAPDECSTPNTCLCKTHKTSTKGWRTRGPEFCPYFLLNDLWDLFEEWSA
ncbi:hypothetical protein Rs2_14041 [Raphanus sativus]|nr:hypothetical protein Rs2_14041 [Raphanus sativus]